MHRGCNLAILPMLFSFPSEFFSEPRGGEDALVIIRIHLLNAEWGKSGFTVVHMENSI